MKVSLTMLLKTNGEEMPVCGFATMLMKKSKLSPLCHDVLENKLDSCIEAPQAGGEPISGPA
jgi:hypothetical protein